MAACPVGSQEREDPDGIEQVSRAIQPAALASMPRPWRGTWFSRLKRRNSTRSVPVRPSSLRPSSRLARPTQRRIAWVDGSNSRANSFAERHDRSGGHVLAELGGVGRTCNSLRAPIFQVFRYLPRQVESTHPNTRRPLGSCDHHEFANLDLRPLFILDDPDQLPARHNANSVAELHQLIYVC